MMYACTLLATTTTPMTAADTAIALLLLLAPAIVMAVGACAVMHACDAYATHTYPRGMRGLWATLGTTALLMAGVCAICAAASALSAYREWCTSAAIGGALALGTMTTPYARRTGKGGARTRGWSEVYHWEHLTALPLDACMPVVATVLPADADTHGVTSVCRWELDPECPCMDAYRAAASSIAPDGTQPDTDVRPVSERLDAAGAIPEGTTGTTGESTAEYLTRLEGMTRAALIDAIRAACEQRGIKPPAMSRMRHTDLVALAWDHGAAWNGGEV